MKLIIFVFFVLSVGFVNLAQAEESASNATKTQRNYPGGRDEEDLVVQQELKAPTVAIDRQTINQRILKNNFKKTIENTTDEAEEN